MQINQEITKLLRMSDLPIAYVNKLSNNPADALVHIPGIEKDICGAEIEGNPVEPQDISKAERYQLILDGLNTELTTREIYDLMYSLGQLYHKKDSSTQMREGTFKQICTKARKQNKIQRPENVQSKVKRLVNSGWTDLKISDSLKISMNQVSTARFRLKLSRNK